MIWPRLRALAVLAVLLTGTAGAAERIVTVGGNLTEIVYALGLGDNLVAADTTSTHPEAAQALPSVGYQRALSAEGILAQAPTLVLATHEAGPPGVLAQLKAAGVNLVLLDSEPRVEAALERIEAVGAALGRSTQSRALAAELDQRLQRLQRKIDQLPTRPRVMFMFSTGQGAPLVAGRDTAPSRMISLAGGSNVIEAYEGFRPLNPEAVVAAAPDVLLLPESTLRLLGGRDGLRRLPGLATTPAVREGRIIVMDHLYLVGFSTRLADAVRDLAAALHPQADWSDM